MQLQNFLIWAPPGTGKTFLLQQIRDSIGETCEFIEVNVAKHSAESIRNKLDTIPGLKKSVLCFIDEIDSPIGADWICDVCFGRLEDNTTKDTPARVFVFAGSDPNGLQAMKQKISSFLKGVDFLNRIPDVQKHVSLPSITVDEQLGIFASKIYKPEDGSVGCSSIEKTALYYILSRKELLEPRALNDFAKAALKRRDTKDPVLRFGNLFNLQSPHGNEFWAANSTMLHSLLHLEVLLLD